MLVCTALKELVIVFLTCLQSTWAVRCNVIMVVQNINHENTEHHLHNFEHLTLMSKNKTGTADYNNFRAHLLHDCGKTDSKS